MSFSPPDSLKYEVRGSTCYITLNRPQAMNALNRELQQALPEAIEEYEADPSLLAAVITGEGGRAFSAGADLKEVASFVGTDRDPRRTATRREPQMLLKMESCRKPLIAAVDGYAFAGGCELAMVCDIRIATRTSQFAIPEVKRSIIAGVGTTHLPRMIPLGESLMMTMTGEPITAQRAYEIGMIQGLADDRDDLLAKADKIAAAIAGNPPLAVQDVKRIVKVGASMPLEYAIHFREKYADTIMATEDAKEGAAAFAEKRAPVWKSR